MKKKLFYSGLLLSVLTLGCTGQDDIVGEINRQEAVSSTHIRPLSEAMQIADDAISMFNQNGSRSLSKEIDKSNAFAIFPKTGSRLNREVPQMYVVNYKDEKGYALIAADKKFPAVLAVTERGSLSESNLQENPGVALFLEAAATYLCNSPNSSNLDSITWELKPDRPGGDLLESKHTTDTLEKIIVDPRLSVRWGQNFPEGMLCPNGYCGCTATAMAMAMSYFKKAHSFSIAFSESPKQHLALDWSVLLNHKQSYSRKEYFEILDICYNNQLHTDLSILCRHLADLVRSVYLPDGTSAQAENAVSQLRSMGYPTSEISDYSMYSTRMAMYRQNSIIFLFGRISAESNSGHIWLMDGVRYYKVHHADYIKKQNYILWELQREWDEVTSYNHMNWGWDGNGNGYFLSDVFDPSASQIMDDGFRNPITDYAPVNSSKISYFYITE